MPTNHDDRAEIYELVCSYCRAVDRLDLDGVRAVYAEDGVDHHTGFSGSADEYVAWLGRMLPALDGTMHIVGNQLVEVFGDEAVAETYGQAVHWGRPAESSAVNFTSGFRYVDHLVRREGAWRIRERWAVREWTRSDAGRFVPRSAPGPTAARDRSDPVHVLLDRLRGSSAGG